MLNNELICFEMIASFGSASAMFMEAIQYAKAGQYQEAQEAIEEGEKAFIEGHSAHAGLIQAFANNEKIEVTLLLMHAEDQMMNVEMLKIVALELMDVYQVLQKNTN